MEIKVVASVTGPAAVSATGAPAVIVAVGVAVAVGFVGYGIYKKLSKE